MAKEVTCPPCGAIIPDHDDSEVLANVRQHALDHGNEMPPGMTVEDFGAQVLSEAREVASAWRDIRRERGAPRRCAPRKSDPFGDALREQQQR